MSDEFDKRITELEMTVTHQEQTINELSDVITEQWESIEKLRRQISKLDATKADIDPEEEADRTSATLLIVCYTKNKKVTFSQWPRGITRGWRLKFHRGVRLRLRLIHGGL